MERLLLIAGIGFLAQLIDGSLGMSYGATSTSLLLSAGIAPAVASATVHLAEVGTTFVSGVSHTRFGNVDWRMVGLLALPGAIAAFLGATLLSSLEATTAATVIAGILLIIGIYILARFAGAVKPVEPGAKPLRRRFLVPLGGIGGFVDAIGGGGWGPVGTTSLLASGRVEPRKAIGTIDTSEFVIAVAASVGFLIGLGSEAIDWPLVGALLVAGCFAAPLAAWLVKHLNPRILGVGVGSILLITNTNTLLGAVDEPEGVAAGGWTLIGLAIAAGAAVTLVRWRRGSGGTPATA